MTVEQRLDLSQGGYGQGRVAGDRHGIQAVYLDGHGEGRMRLVPWRGMVPELDFGALLCAPKAVRDQIIARRRLDATGFSDVELL